MTIYMILNIAVSFVLLVALLSIYELYSKKTEISAERDKFKELYKELFQKNVGMCTKMEQKDREIQKLNNICKLQEGLKMEHISDYKRIILDVTEEFEKQHKCRVDDMRMFSSCDVRIIKVEL